MPNTISNGVITAEQLHEVMSDLTTKADDRFELKSSLGTAAAKDVPTSGNASTIQVVMGNDTRLSDSRPASDVSSWAKASTKPTYTKSEVGLSNVGNFKAVSTAASQGLTATEQKNARANISAPATTSVIQVTISASGWNSSTGVYSFESSYPNASYDIDDILPNDNTTDAQREAWIAADCGGYRTTNTIKAHGDIPTIDIVVSLFVRAK